ncbi:histidinol dehydrogenase [Microbacterium dauci]|uniref:Histidinol dehydrogenase n=1 Tax=Microbacterium dauci TaxID=3048008 RepID=A0ABT6ZBE2_9MICO|nr:histidinol dehydrogenase [Microbacterium sp. LX3-4]MDJ1113478.1 histidinol dehydrogenase [Microbacterium sp. LX3-4]
MNPLFARIATWLVAAVLGFVYGVACVIGQAAMWGVLPVGLITAIVGLAAMLVAIRVLTGERATALAAGIGALAATVILSGRGPGGSIVVPAAPEGEITTGVIWTIVVPLIAAIVVAWPSASSLRPTN